MSRTKRFISKFVKTKWLNISQIKNGALSIKDVGAKLLIPKAKKAPIKLKPIDLKIAQEKVSLYKVLSLIFLILGIGVVSYAISYIDEISFITFLSILCLSLPFYSLAFRYSFWSFQIQHNKLGCNIKTWLKSFGFNR
jgi:intracellular multiplication protein IcmV